MTDSFRRKLILSAGAFTFVILAAWTTLRVHGNHKLNEAVRMYREQAGPIEIWSYAPREVLPSRNAAVWIANGVEAIVLDPEEWKLTNQMLDIPYEKWEADAVSTFHEIWKRNDPAFKILARTITLNDSNFGLDYGAGIEMDIRKMHLKLIIDTRKLLRLKAEMHISKREFTDALQIAAILERMAASLKHEPVLISWLIGSSIEQDYCDLILQLLPYSDENMLAQFVAQLKHLALMQAPPERVLSAEGAAFYRTFLLKSPPFKDFIESEEVYHPLVWIYRIDQRMFLSELLDVYREQVEASKQFPGKNLAEKFPVRDGHLKRILKESLGPNLPSVVERLQLSASTHIPAELALKVRQHALSTGSYPVDLSGFSPEVSPYTGEPVRYEVLQDGSAVLSFPESEKVWSERLQEAWKHKPLLEWKLPPAHSGRY